MCIRDSSKPEGERVQTSGVSDVTARDVYKRQEFAVGDWCRFCKAKNTCRARAEEYLRLAQMEFLSLIHI